MKASVTGVLLAGGQARRMGGGDKGLRALGGRPIMDYVVERARPQVAALLINANGDPERFSGYGLDVAADVINDGAGGFAGPLAGVLTGMEWAAENQPQCPWVATFACDAPFAPLDLVARFVAAVEGGVKTGGAVMACAASRGWAHPVFGLWPVAKAAELRQAMREEEMRKIDRWTARYNLIEVDFAAGPFDPFFNINAPENLAEAERLLNGERGAA